MAKAVIFDMDGVLVNSEPYHFEVERILLKKMGFTITDNDLENFVGLGVSRMWSDIKKRYNLKQEIEELVEMDTVFRVDYFSRLEKLEPIEGIRELLESVKSYSLKTAVASSSHSDLISVVMKKTDLSGYFPELVSGFDVEKGKPEPDIFLKTASLLGVTPGDCVVIEDSFNGVTAAKKGGMKCIAYRNPESGNQDLSGADMIIDRYSSISGEFLKNY